MQTRHDSPDAPTSGYDPDRPARADAPEADHGNSGLPRPDRRTPEERAAVGRAARSVVPRSSHGEFQRPHGAPDPVDLLVDQGRHRVPELLPIRYGRMLVSPFAFYRGAAAIMASDLASTPTTALSVQLCGDAHLANFGGFASPERRMVFDVNDFDETLPGPWEWDVKRLITSLEVAGRQNGYSPTERRQINQAASREYRRAMARFAGMRSLDVWYASLDVESILGRIRSEIAPSRMKRLRRDVSKARTKDSSQALAKLTRVVDGTPRIVADPPLIVPIDDLLPDAVSRTQLVDELAELLGTYPNTLPSDRRYLLSRFQLVHLARKVVGVGSVGTRTWIGLLIGRDQSDALFLQMKEAQRSVLEPILGDSEFSHHGQRVVTGQRLMQSVSDIFLGWERVHGLDGVRRDFYVRQLRDWKFAVELEALLPVGMELYGRICAWTLAKAHARSGDPIAISAYLGPGQSFDAAVGTFAVAYADQNESDYDCLVAAAKAGRIQAQSGL